MTTPRTCTGCGIAPVATAQSKYCFACRPGGPHPPPPCRRCASTENYYSAGLCRRCHRFAPQLVDSCVDCYGWGVTRGSGWLCEGCRGWRRRFFTVGECWTCRRMVPLNEQGFCRLCRRQAAMVRTLHRDVGTGEANRYGQQLFLADLFRQRRDRFVVLPQGAVPRHQCPVGHRQLVLFELPRDLVSGRTGVFPEPTDCELAAFLDETARDHAARHGWSRTRVVTARQALRILLGLQDTPGVPIKASQVAEIAQIGLAVQPVLEILATIGMLDDDREPSVVAWFAKQIDRLPEPMTSEVRVWFDVLHTGSTTAPRRRPRSPGTVRHLVSSVMPTLWAWAAAGHESLREISRDDVLAALPPGGSPRATLGQGLRSLFTILKARKVIFANPLARIRTGRPETREPLPLGQLTMLREALDSGNPPRAALAALVAFHGLRNQQLRDLQLSDVRDGRLRIGERSILLAPPVRERLTAYLDHRGRRWPTTVNPHLFINVRTAVRTGRVSHLYINQTVGLPVQLIREDRILHEAHATGGDVRRLCDLFGLSVVGAQRYTATLDHPGMSQLDEPALR
jgi:hypothetical protein